MLRKEGGIAMVHISLGWRRYTVRVMRIVQKMRGWNALKTSYRNKGGRGLGIL